MSLKIFLKTQNLLKINQYEPLDWRPNETVPEDYY